MGSGGLGLWFSLSGTIFGFRVLGLESRVPGSAGIFRGHSPAHMSRASTSKRGKDPVGTRGFLKWLSFSYVPTFLTPCLGSTATRILANGPVRAYQGPWGMGF